MIKADDLSQINRSSKKCFSYQLWEKFSLCNYFKIQTRSLLLPHKEWNFGEGYILQTWLSSSSWSIQEKGYWTNLSSRKLNFFNNWHWNIDSSTETVCIRRFRHFNSPVILSLKHSAGRLISTAPYICGKDYYYLFIDLGLKKIKYHWKIIGPKKIDEIICLYY